MYIGCLSLCLPARLLWMVNLIGQIAAEPQVDAAPSVVSVSLRSLTQSTQYVFVSNPPNCGSASKFGELLGRL